MAVSNAETKKQTEDAKKASSSALRRAWEHTTKIGKFMKDNPMQPLGIGGAVLLGTTALATPMLASTIGAAAVALGSIYLLTKTSDVVVNNVSALGKKWGINPLVLGIGLGIVTSLPELAVSIGSIMAGVPDMAIGNIIGSNIANTCLVLGAAAAIKPINSKGTSWKFNAAVMGGTTALFATQMAMGALNPIMGAAMLGGLGFYMWKAIKAGKKDEELGLSADAPADDGEDDEAEQKMSKWFNMAWGAAGVAGLVTSANLLVGSGSALAIGLGVAPALVGALGIAIGTSLPELVVSVKAARAGKSEMALGNVLGSNIFNVMMVGGAVALAGTAVPLAFGLGSALGLLNIGAFVGAAALSGAAMFLNKKKGSIKRWQGGVGLGLYAAFTAASIALDSGQAAVYNKMTPDKAEQVQQTEQVQRETGSQNRLEEGQTQLKQIKAMRPI